jgi:hypothetical protein
VSAARREDVVGSGVALSSLQAALSREGGVAAEMLLTKAEQVSDDGAAPPDYALRNSQLVASTVTALVTEQKSGRHRVALLRFVLNESAVIDGRRDCSRDGAVGGCPVRRGSLSDGGAPGCDGYTVRRIVVSSVDV